MSNDEPLIERVRLLFVHSAAIIAGGVLFAIGLSGGLGVPIYPVEELSFLTRPMPIPDVLNNYYWTLLAFVGVWLMLCVMVRFAAASALCLIVLKWAVLNGYISLFADNAAPLS